MYGKLMSIPDKAMGIFSRLVTSWTPEEISKFEADLASGNRHPKEAKMALAKEIVTIYHGSQAAEKAEKNFVQVFQEQGLPADMDQYQLRGGETVLDVLVEAGLTESRSKAKRLISQNAVKLEGEKLTEPHQVFPGKGVLQVGKRRFMRII
jgi:tyrosyl-tRNA synthetase